MPLTIERFADRDALNAAVADLIIAIAQRPLKQPRGIMLSGGSTPLAIFREVAERQPEPAAPSTHLIFADDRLVPVTSHDSNLGNARQLIDALAIPAERVIAIRGDLDPTPAARKYNQDLDQFFAASGKLSLGLLGLGSDGHTCSIFTEEAALLRDRYAFPVRNRGGFDRVSVSPIVLDRAERLIFLVAGKSKATILDTFIADPISTPAGMAVKDHDGVEIWTDLPNG